MGSQSVVHHGRLCPAICFVSLKVKGTVQHSRQVIGVTWNECCKVFGNILEASEIHKNVYSTRHSWFKSAVWTTGLWFVFIGSRQSLVNSDFFYQHYFVYLTLNYYIGSFCLIPIIEYTETTWIILSAREHNVF